MRLAPVALAVAAAALVACCGSDSGVAPSTTTTSLRVAPATSTTTTLPATEPAAVPRPLEERLARLRERRPRTPRLPRQAIRAELASTLAARRPDRPLPPGELEQLTNKAMQIRVMRGRLDRMRPALRETPRAMKLRERLAVMLDEFQTRAGVAAADLSAILEPAPAPPRRGE